MNLFKQRKAQYLNIPLIVIGGIAALVIGALVLLLLVNVLRTSNVLTSGSAEATAFTGLAGNVTTGMNNLSGYVPTVFTVAAVVMILGIITLLYFFFKNR
jgi:hypothetical protein